MERAGIGGVDLETFMALQLGRVRTSSTPEQDIAKRRFQTPAKGEPAGIEHRVIDGDIPNGQDPVRYWYQRTGLLYE